MNDQLTALLSDIFNCDPLQLTDETTPDDIEGWDSVAMVGVIVELEDAYGIELSMADAAAMVSIGSIMGIIESRRRSDG